VRPILFVPPSMPAIDLLAKMQATRIHLALVVDEYGGTDGIVSIEDVVELIVGNIEDEHDDEQSPGITRQSDGSFVADARASLEDVIAAVGKGFDVGEALNNVDTLAGYLVTQVGRVPVRGELVPGPAGFEFEVLDADPRRVKKVRIHRGRNRKSERGRETQGASPAPKAPQALPRDSGPIKPTQQP
jgi:CBS domain containing-hemolysin-like protein